MCAHICNYMWLFQTSEIVATSYATNKKTARKLWIFKMLKDGDEESNIYKQNLAIHITTEPFKKP